MKSNFEFLKEYWPALAQIGEKAENYLYSDPNACHWHFVCVLYSILSYNEIFIVRNGVKSAVTDRLV